MGNFLLNSANIRDYIGRQVFDRRFQNDYGLGVIASTFTISGEIGCRVHYSLDRLVLKSDGSMSGVIVNGPVSGTINGGQSYVRLDQMSARYESANPATREGSILGMNWNPAQLNGTTASPTSTGTMIDYKLHRVTYTDMYVSYYPDYPKDYTNGSGGISLLTLL